MSAHSQDTGDFTLILGNSNRRFSGVTSTMLQVLEHQKTHMELVVLGEHHLNAGTRSVGFFELAKLCRRLPEDGKPRVFHARRNNEMIQALLLKHVFGAKIKIVFTSTAQRHHSSFSRFLMGRVDAILSTCTAAASYLRKRPDEIIPHGIETKDYFPSSDRATAWKELGYGGTRGIGIFGRVRKQKGVDLLVDAAIDVLPNHPDFNVIIGGEITPEQKLFQEELTRKINQANLGDRIRFLGKRPFEELPILFRSVSLVAALSRNEGFGLTVLEAMASGTAVLTSEAGAWKDLVDDGKEGRIVACDDLAAITQALDDLLSQPERLEEMGKVGREKVLANYTVENEAKALCDFFEALRNNSDLESDLG